uniref:Uncharacterized protein n=1 Tax=Rangifer tarandus platyrhynchus TaxID=3082113 RepID=A0ACB0FKP8_RANTA|nr:unnamed protein product [Rangifer tarandus platyrhynchus]
MPGARLRRKPEGRPLWGSKQEVTAVSFRPCSSGASGCPHQTGSPLSLSHQRSLMAQTMLPPPSDVSAQGPILNPRLHLRCSGRTQCGGPRLPRAPSRLGHRSPSQEPRWRRRQGWSLPVRRHHRGEHTTPAMHRHRNSLEAATTPAAPGEPVSIETGVRLQAHSDWLQEQRQPALCQPQASIPHRWQCASGSRGDDAERSVWAWKEGMGPGERWRQAEKGGSKGTALDGPPRPRSTCSPSPVSARAYLQGQGLRPRVQSALSATRAAARPGPPQRRSPPAAALGQSAARARPRRPARPRPPACAPPRLPARAGAGDGEGQGRTGDGRDREGEGRGRGRGGGGPDRGGASRDPAGPGPGRAWRGAGQRLAGPACAAFLFAQTPGLFAHRRWRQ